MTYMSWGGEKQGEATNQFFIYRRLVQVDVL